MSEIEQLNAIFQALKEKKTATPVTIRNFLWWFGAQRRTPNNVAYINEQLAEVGLRTVPNYLNRWVDTPITFELANDQVQEEDGNSLSDNEDASSQANDGPPSADKDAADPSYTIGEIESANNPPVRVTPNASLLQATTLMLARNFSQLPVMSNDRDVKGVISWASIGARLSKKVSEGDVQAYMDGHQELPISASLFSAISTIVTYDYVLIRGRDRTITGIVTATDIALQFEAISAPFLLIAEIEKHLRILISKKLSISDIKQACAVEHLPKEFLSAADLTFGNYVKVLEHPANWSKLELQLDRATFCAELAEINAVRNEVMHFDPDPLSKQDLSKLRNVAKMLNLLRHIGAF